MFKRKEENRTPARIALAAIASGLTAMAAVAVVRRQRARAAVVEPTVRKEPKKTEAPADQQATA